MASLKDLTGETFKEAYGVKRKNLNSNVKKDLLGYARENKSNLDLSTINTFEDAKAAGLTSGNKAYINPLSDSLLGKNKGIGTQKFFNLDLKSTPLPGTEGLDMGALPDSGVSGIQGNMTNLGNSATNTLLNISGGQIANAGIAGADRGAALGNLANLQRQALSPTISPEQRLFFQDMADQERANINARFAQGGDIWNAAQATYGSDMSDLAARGIVDSQTAANTMGYRQSQLGALAAQLLGEADIRDQERQLAERSAIRDAAGQFGGFSTQEAGTAGNLLANLLAGGSSSASAGFNTGLNALTGAGSLGLESRGLEADLQLADIGQQLASLFGNYDLFNSMQNQKQNMTSLEQYRDLQEQLRGLAGL